MARIRVKVIGNYQNHLWIRQFPGRKPVWGDCEFFFDRAHRNYDWLVIYNDFPGNCSQFELHPGHRENSLLVTTEPSTIKVYGHAYTRQFGHVLTSQPEWALRHPGRIFSQPALQWFYGLKGDNSISFDDMLEHPPTDKRADIATVCSNKKQWHTLHKRRFAFTQALKQRLPQLEIFGQGVRPIIDKSEAINSFRYHLAIENFIGLHHWTEKLADPFLGLALPFYIGCPNADEYFPRESFIPLDINDVDGAAETIRETIQAGEYERRLPSLLEARRLVMFEYNLFAVLARLIPERHQFGGEGGALFRSRHQLRKDSKLTAARDLWEKVRVRGRHLLARQAV